ncbi:MAG: calcium-binding protein [Cyanobacteria bacterium P01_F01_bin.53]
MVLIVVCTREPAEGVQVSVTAEGLEEFDLSEIETTGITGDISVTESDPPQLVFTVTEETATITLPAANDGESEGVETATFTLNPSGVYQADPLAASGNFQIVDTPEDAPTPSVETASNNTLETAIPVNFSDADPVVVAGEVNYVVRTFADLSISPVVDITEDVDLFSFELGAGESIEVNVDATTELDGSNSLLKPVLRLFDADGSELDTVGQVDSLAQISAELGEANLTFTAETAGTYYAGISALGNDDYDPSLSGSGSGWLIDDVAEPGAYQVRFSQTSEPSDQTLDQTLLGTAADDTLEAGSGNDTVAGELGNDVITGGGGDDVLRGDANSRSPQDNETGGNDIIFGGGGNDRIGGKAGNDILSGDAGDDLIWGDNGDDIIMGMTGNDTLVGDNNSDGVGSDLFVFGNGDGTDTILDFEVGIDRIGLVEGELVFAELTLTQDGANTLLGVTSTGETLAVLNNVQVSALGETSFEIVPDVSNPDEALALI